MSLDLLCEITSNKGWRMAAESYLFRGIGIPASPCDLGTYWIEAGHRIREQIGDDRLLCNFLKSVLPPYSGDTLTLYRGENLARWRAGSVGFAWSESIEIGRMFGQGLNSIYSGGVLLRAIFAPSAIISGLNAHSSYLQESQFTVDPAFAKDLEQIEVYPPQ